MGSCPRPFALARPGVLRDLIHWTRLGSDSAHPAFYRSLEDASAREVDQAGSNHSVAGELCGHGTAQCCAEEGDPSGTPFESRLGESARGLLLQLVQQRPYGDFIWYCDDALVADERHALRMDRSPRMGLG